MGTRKTFKIVFEDREAKGPFTVTWFKRHDDPDQVKEASGGGEAARGEHL